MPDHREHESNELTAAFNQRLTAASNDNDALAHIVAHFAADSGRFISSKRTGCCTLLP